MVDRTDCFERVGGIEIVVVLEETYATDSCVK